LEYQSLKKTIEHFESTADATKLTNLMFEHWVKPPIFEDAKVFLEKCPVPVYIVSNIDTADILQAIAFHNLTPTGVFTSEDARSYKPGKELFEYALEKTGLTVKDVVHIGDSMSSDVNGAKTLGIHPIWLNRGGRPIPEGVVAVNRLDEVLELGVV
jgi:2-haloacid dehalogenase/putative hydrolase of the HAD superfamily